MKKQNDYLIRQKSEKEFIILKKFKEETTHGFLWWKKTITKEEYHRIDKYGMRFLMTPYPFYFNNFNDFETYETLEDAKKWIENYNKYPIDYYFKKTY